MQQGLQVMHMHRLLLLPVAVIVGIPAFHYIASSAAKLWCCVPLLLHQNTLCSLMLHAFVYHSLQNGARAVSAEEGAAFARAHGCLYRETSAKTDCGGVDEGVYDALVWGMVATILDTPGLAGSGSRHINGQGVEIGSRRRQGHRSPLAGCC